MIKSDNLGNGEGWALRGKFIKICWDPTKKPNTVITIVANIQNKK